MGFFLSRWRRADPGTEQHGDLRRIFRLEVGSLGAFKSLLVRQLTCGEAYAAIWRAHASFFQGLYFIVNSKQAKF